MEKDRIGSGNDNFPDKKTSRRAFLKSAGTAAGIALASTTMGTARRATAAEPEKTNPQMKYLFAERQNCVGCRACEYACSLHHEGVVWPAKSRIHVYKHKGVVDVPVICWHCDDAPCIKACPTAPKAIEKDPKTNGIKLDAKLCLGAKCNKCIEACPSKFIRRDDENGLPLMCDLCDGDPECVKACEAQAGNPVGPCLMANKLGFGVNQSYRNVTPDEAGEDLINYMFYPNEDGERRS